MIVSKAIIKLTVFVMAILGVAVVVLEYVVEVIVVVVTVEVMAVAVVVHSTTPFAKE